MYSTRQPQHQAHGLFTKTIKQADLVEDRRHRLSIEFGLLMLLLGIIFVISASNLSFNTLFIDEAIPLSIGKGALTGYDIHNAATWMLGSYLYPIVAALISPLGGIVGLRLLSAILGTLSTLFIALAALQTFGWRSAVWSALIFGFSSSAILLSQLAVIDALAIPLFALALYFLVKGITSSKKQVDHFLLLAAIIFSFSVLTKYIGLFYLPTFILVGIILCVIQNRSATSVVTLFLCPVIFILGAYASYSLLILTDLIAQSDQYFIESNNYSDVIYILGSTLGVSITLLILMLVMNSGSIIRFMTKSSSQTRRPQSLPFSLLLLLILSILLVPIYQLVSKNIFSLSTHSLYSLVFLAPIAGFCLSDIVDKIQMRNGKTLYRIMGAALTLGLLFWQINITLDHQWSQQNSWPSVAGIINHLEKQNIPENAYVLAEGAQIYEYYLANNTNTSSSIIWQNTWYMEYDGKQGIEAMKAAITDHAFEYIILDNYHHPDTAQVLTDHLTQAGYAAEYEEVQTLHIEQGVKVQVFSLDGGK